MAPSTTSSSSSTSKNPTPTIVLASSSKYRAELLRRIQLTFSAISPEIDEQPQPNETAINLVQRLALEKAQAGAASDQLQNTSSLIIGSDQVAEWQGQTLGKPHTRDNAIAQLHKLSGHDVRFLTSLCLLNTSTGQHDSYVDETRVAFRDLTQAEIEQYLDAEEPYDCAGSFKSEALGIALFDGIHTNDPTALIGLPLIKLCTMLRKQNYSVLEHATPNIS